ncbi:339_t:CDS:2 [Funneliformis caledonium]|uniref:339_t:CDS:1 n=1 Tax=Funneliformis caledonium TaxID=1117310 RepID=A0A9N9DZH5_9GLOM|nr:339_t:CDS:2 [Funneliformis caledonium]
MQHISSVEKGRKLEERVVRVLRSVNIECERIGGPGDGGIDVIGRIVDTPFIIQCKNWHRNIGPSVVREIEGVLTRYPNTIAVIVASSKNNFYPAAIETAKSSVFNIILTDPTSICEDLISIVEIHWKFMDHGT